MMISAQFRPRAVCLVLCLLFWSCRARYESNVSDLQARAPAANAGIDLLIDTAGVSRSNFTIDVSSAELVLWSTHDDREIKDKLNERLSPYSLDNKNWLRTNQLSGLGPVKIQSDSNKLTFKEFPGISGTKVVNLKQVSGTMQVNSQDLSTKLFSSCPVTFVASDSGFANDIGKKNSSSSSAPVKIENVTDAPTIKEVLFKPRGIYWKIECNYAISWSDLAENKILAQFQFNLNIEGDQVIFPRIIKDLNFPVIRKSEFTTEKNGFGTRFFSDETKTIEQDGSIQRWNPKRTSIVIDDTEFASGNDLQSSDLGRMTKESLKVAAADLRVKFPEFGRKIKLRSETPGSKPDIAFNINEQHEKSEVPTKLVDNDSGELKHARVSILDEAKIHESLRMLTGFAELGLIPDAKKSFKEAFEMMVIHALGHALGLRHNFSGYGMYQNWGNDLQAAMSYALLGIPVDFLTDRLEFKPHDILSLKILYADVTPELAESRPKLIDEILSYRLSEDDLPDHKGGIQEHLANAIKYLEGTNNPNLLKFRETDPDWKEKIKAVYKTAYGIPL
jgi:hypothetical protein